MDFGPCFVKTIQPLFDSPLPHIFLSNHYSEEFTLSRGTRQGCLLSPILFAISLEPLVIAIRSNPNITGVTIGGEDHVVSLFTDDMVIYLTNPSISLPSLMAVIQMFGQVSGLAINYSKSEIHAIALLDRIKHTLIL